MMIYERTIWPREGTLRPIEWGYDDVFGAYLENCQGICCDGVCFYNDYSITDMVTYYVLTKADWENEGFGVENFQKCLEQLGVWKDGMKIIAPKEKRRWSISGEPIGNVDDTDQKLFMKRQFGNWGKWIPVNSEGEWREW